MAFEVTQINEKQKNMIMRLSESHFMDLKGIDILPRKLTKGVSAFANADGGDLYVDINEDRASRSRKWKAFTDIEGANSHIQAIDSISAIDPLVSYQFLSYRNCQGLVLQISVRKTTSRCSTTPVRRSMN